MTQNLSVLPAIVCNLITLFRNKCKGATKLHCPVQAQEMTANEMFYRARNYIFVRSQCLPLDPDIKAVGINFVFPKLYVETTLVDWQMAEQHIKQCQELELRGRTFYWKGNKIVVSNSRSCFANGASPRTLFWTTQPLNAIETDPLAVLFDAIYEYNCFKEEAAPKVKRKILTQETEALVPEIKMEQKQDMRQELLQLIQLEQRPVMAMQMRINARSIERIQVLAMNRGELQHYIDCREDEM